MQIRHTLCVCVRCDVIKEERDRERKKASERQFKDSYYVDQQRLLEFKNCNIKQAHSFWSGLIKICAMKKNV